MAFSAIWLILKNLPWKYIIPVLAVLGILGGVYFAGVHHESAIATAKIAHYEQEMKDKGVKIQNGQIVVEKQVVTQYQTVHDKIYIQSKNNKGLISSVPGITSKGTLPVGWIQSYNDSALGVDSTQAGISNSTDSHLTPNDVLPTIHDNNAQCRDTINQLTQLQQWILQTQQNIKAANK